LALAHARDYTDSAGSRLALASSMSRAGDVTGALSNGATRTGPTVWHQRA